MIQKATKGNNRPKRVNCIYYINMSHPLFARVCLLGLALKVTRDYLLPLDPTFGSFTLLELDSLVKVFRAFRLEWIFFVVQSVGSIG
jgi:hypothetical protein